MMMKNIAIIALTGLALSACTTNEKKTAGTLIGAAGGAVIGAQFGSGAGQVLGAAIGAVGGGFIGHEVGKQM